MSVRLMGAVFHLGLTATEKLVLLAMADHARDDGTGCYPSIDRLAKKTSLSGRGVQKIARRLEKAGFIVPSGTTKGGRGLATEYRITLEKGEPGSLFSTPKGRTPEQERANLSAQKGEPRSPQPSGTVMEPSGCAQFVRGENLRGQLQARPTPNRAHHPPAEELKFRRELRKLAGSQHLGGATRSNGDGRRAHLEAGIYRKGVADVYFDARHLPPEQAIRDASDEAALSLLSNRAVELRGLNLDDVRHLAWSKLRPGVQTLGAIGAYERRRDCVVGAVTNAVVDAALALRRPNREVAAGTTGSPGAGP